MSDSNRKYRIGGYQPGSKPNNAKSHTGNRFTSETLPPKVDLRQFMTAVESQVGNSCVANAFVGAYEYLAKRHRDNRRPRSSEPFGNRISNPRRCAGDKKPFA